mgnify:CR=1 FL=1
MEFNLIPQEQRPSSWSLLALRLSKKLAALLVVVTLAVGAAGAIFQMRTIWEQERFTDQAFPIQKRIVQQNEWERKLHELKERHDETRIAHAQLSRVPCRHQAGRRICRKIEMRRHVLSISGMANEVGTERKWQDALRRQPSVRSVSASRMKQAGQTAETAFLLEVEWANDEQDTSRQKA